MKHCLRSAQAATICGTSLADTIQNITEFTERELDASSRHLLILINISNIYFKPWNDKQYIHVYTCVINTS